VPFLGVQLLVLGATLAFPSLVHLVGDRAVIEAPAAPVLSPDQVDKVFDSIPPPPAPEDPQR